MKNKFFLNVTFFTILFLNACNSKTTIEIKEAEDLYLEKEFDSVISKTSLIIANNKKNTKALVLRAQSYVKKENYEKAVIDCDKAIEIDPNYSDAYITRAMAKNNNESIEDLNIASEIEGQSSKTYYYKGVLYQKLGDDKKSTFNFRKSIEAPKAGNNESIRYSILSALKVSGEQNPFKSLQKFRESDAKILIDLTKMLNTNDAKCGKIEEYAFIYLFEIKEYKEALKWANIFEKRIKNDILMEGLGLVKAVSLYKTGKEKESLRYIELLDKKKFKSNESILEIYKICKEMKKWDVSLPWISKAIINEPRDIELYKEREEVYNKLGEKKMAENDRNAIKEIINEKNK